LAIRDALVVVNDMEAAGVIGRYAICGALAAYVYVEPALTEDMDVLVTFANASMGGGATGLIKLTPIISYLASKGFDQFHNAGIIVSGWPVRFLPVANALNKEALAEAKIADVVFEKNSPPVRVRVLQPEHLVATALSVGRLKDMIRVSQFLNEEAVDFDQLRDVIIRHGLVAKWREFVFRSGAANKIAV
jgi:hypothetical protein